MFNLKNEDSLNNHNEKIILAIASYCDKELLNTVKSALIQADNPSRIYFSICYQSDDLRDYKKLKKIKNCKIKYLKASEAKGLCYARYLCQQMIGDEKYVYQIDSHMRFVKHWDNKLIEQLVFLKDPYASISFYPPNCTKEMMKLPLNDKIFDNPGIGCIMCVKKFKKEFFPFIEIESFSMSPESKEFFKKSPLISGGNFFTYGNIYKSVLEDPKMFFYGDELPMAIRYYTNGVNNYTAKECYIYHEYVSVSRKMPKVDNGMVIEQKRFLQLLNLNPSGEKNDDIEKYGLGKKRSLKDFEKFSGIDFQNYKIYMNGELGEYDNKQFENRISYLKQKDYQLYQKKAQKDKIEVIIVDLFGEFQQCMESCLIAAMYSGNISFIIGTTSSDRPSSNYPKIKKIVKCSQDDTYTKVLSRLTDDLDDNYVAVVDSSFRFLFGWDKYLLDNIKECADNSVLTSWVWLANGTNIEKSLKPYVNIIKEYKGYNDYLPYLEYNSEIKLEKRKKPYQTPFISDGFLFGNSEIFKITKVDPNLTYKEFFPIYSLRLWTNGIDVFYPNISYLYKIRSEEFYNGNIHNYSTICAIQGMNNYYSRNLDEGYQYDIGKIRTIWSWYDFMKFDYTKDKNFAL